MTHASFDSEDFGRALGEAFRQARAQQGMSQETLALRSGVTQKHISGIERGLTRPSFEVVYRLMLALGEHWNSFAAGIDSGLGSDRYGR